MNIFNINGYDLDDTQISAIKSNAQNTLVVAGAGSGKSLTILGLINYLIKEKKYKENEILAISFTNEATLSLHNKILDLGYDIESLTFHKLGIKLITHNSTCFARNSNRTFTNSSRHS
jgi:DNA helicase-4